MKILCITSRIPWPLEKGDKLRIYHQLRMLSRQHELILFAVNDGDVHPDALKALAPFCSKQVYHTHSKWQLMVNLIRGLFNGKPFQVAYFNSYSAVKKLRKLIAEEKPEAVYCQLIRTAPYHAFFPADIPSVLDYMDVFSKGVERRIPKVPWLLRWIYRMEWKRLLRYEREVFNEFRSHTVISAQDRDLLPLENNSSLVVVPNGVDTYFFTPTDAVKTHELIFNGNMNYPSNIESAVFIVKEVLPLVWKRMPGVRLMISGASPAPTVMALASEQVTVTGWVDDIRDNFNASRILIAPMKSSIGLQNKLLEGMAMGLPCITTALSNNALGAIPGEEILIAETAQEYASAICSLLEQPEEARRIAERGHRLVHEKFDWQSATSKLEILFTK